MRQRHVERALLLQRRYKDRTNYYPRRVKDGIEMLIWEIPFSARVEIKVEELKKGIVTLPGYY